MEEFIATSHQAFCNKLTLMEGFRVELDEEIQMLMPSGDPSWCLARYLNFALWIAESSYLIGEEEDPPAPDPSLSHSNPSHSSPPPSMIPSCPPPFEATSAQPLSAAKSLSPPYAAMSVTKSKSSLAAKPVPPSSTEKSITPPFTSESRPLFVAHSSLPAIPQVPFRVIG